MVWGPKPDRRELVEELGKDLVEWGEGVQRAYEELPDDDGSLKPDDLQPRRSIVHKPAEPVEAEFRDKKGKLMPCMICGARATIDGRFCKRHRGGY